MNALVTYDVSGKPDEVRAAMLARGYRDDGTSRAPSRDLPDTRLWKRNTQILEALQDIWTAASECRVTLQRAVVVPSEG